MSVSELEQYEIPEASGILAIVCLSPPKEKVNDAMSNSSDLKNIIILNNLNTIMITNSPLIK
jgi:hypothetical protein